MFSKQQICFNLITLSLIIASLIIVVWIILKLIIILNKRKSQQTKFEKIIIILLGSGGHTTQMCLLLNNFKFNSIQKAYVIITKTDKSSHSFFIKSLEQNYTQNFQSVLSKITFINVDRTNQVKQSKITSIFTTLYSIVKIFLLIFSKKLYLATDLIGNGPGYCVPFYFLYFVMKKLKLINTKLIFFESWCRVQSLSLTGKIVKKFADRFIVHWKQQSIKYKGAQYLGKLI